MALGLPQQESTALEIGRTVGTAIRALPLALSSPLQGSASFQAGRIAGVVLFVGLPLVGLIGACVAMRHRDASRKALLGLALVLLSFTIWAGAGSTFALLGSERAMEAMRAPVGRALMGLAGLFALMLQIAGLVLAILGVCDTYRGAGRLSRGRKRGYLAIGLTVCCFGLMMVGLVAQLARSRSMATGGNDRSGGAVAARQVAVEEFNYRITAAASWVTMEPKKVNPLATFAATRVRPQLFEMVLCERLDTPIALEAAAATIEATMQARGPATFTEHNEKVNGHDGILIESELRENGNQVHFINWITDQAGIFYQLVTWGLSPEHESIAQENRRLRESFQIIDAAGGGVPPASAAEGGNYRSDRYGWSVDLKGTWWTRPWSNLSHDVPSAEWGAVNTNRTAFFCVIPIFVEKGVPLEALTHALAAQVGVPFPDDSIYGVRSARTRGRPNLEGQSLAWEGRRQGLDFLCRLRVWQGPTCSYLLAAWYDRNREKYTDLLDEALDRVKFEPDAPKAPPLEELSAPAQARHRLVFNGIGVNEQARGHLAEAMSWYQRAYELGRNDPTILLNYVSAAANLGKAEEGRVYLLGELKRFPGNPKLAMAGADLQMAAGDVSGGLRSYVQLFDSGFRDDAVFAAYLRAACSHGEAESAAATLERYAKGHDAPPLRKLRALLAQGRGDFPAALAILQELHGESPEDVETLSSLADVHFAAQQYADCLADCERLLELKHDSAAVYRRKASAEMALKRYREAKETIELAHARAPGDPEVKRTLDYLSGILGQGANLAVKTPIEPVPLPSDLAPPPEAPASDEYVQGFNAYYRQCLRAIAYERGKERRTTMREVISVLDRQGVEMFSTLEVPFDPLAQEVYVNSVVVKDASGQVTATAKVEDSYVLDEGGGQAATQRKVLHIPVPGLQPGSSLESTITWRETGPVRSFLYSAYSFARSLPVLSSTVVLAAPKGEVKGETSPGIVSQPGQGGLRWTVERPPVFRAEPQMETADRLLPMLWLGEASATWAAEAKEYLGAIKNRLAIDPAVKAAAAEAVKGKTDRAGKVAALTAFVQGELTYKAVEFGRRARIPSPAAETLQNHYGDCKDHALLLTQLLEASGIPAQLALVSFHSQIRAGLPSLDQFDHMIVYTPEQKGGRFIDCTGKFADLEDEGPPFGLAAQPALILDAAHPRLERVPDYPPGSGGLKVERVIAVSGNDADLTVEETVAFTGTLAASMRGALKSVQPADRDRTLLEMLTAQISNLSLQKVEVEQLDDLQAPLRLRLRYFLPQRCQAAGGQLVCRLPAPWERMVLAGTPEEKRAFPFRVWVPTGCESSVRISSASGWKPVLPEKRTLETPFCTGKLDTGIDQQTLFLDGQATVRAGEFAADRYAAYLQAMNEAIGLVEASVVFTR